MFDDLDLTNFWAASKYVDEAYVDAPLTPEMVALVERTLEFKLPAAYVALMQSQNGGIPVRTKHRMAEPTLHGGNFVSISGIHAIGDRKPHSLLGGSGSRFWIEEWGYPEIGVYFADCPSAGHDMLCLDYRACGPSGEPAVVHVDQEFDYEITFVAPDFATFVRGLEPDDAFEID